MGNHQTTGRSRKNKSRDPFSLATFNREEDEESNGHIKLVDNYPGNFQTTITTITADPKSVWKSSRHKGDNESEEELRMEGSKVRSFLITEENV
jgi:hypothetical protein